MDEHVSPVVWQEEPKLRGTFTILTSCLSTLFICTWSALHVDVQHGKSTMARFRDKCGWLLVGLLAPEIVLLIAINQFLEARSLTRAAQERFRDTTTPPPSAKRNPWVHISCQLRSRRVRETTTEAQDSSEHETSRPAPAGLHGRTHPWTLTHGFYATMGGFALAREDAKPTDPPHYLPSWQRNGVLTPKGVLLVIEHAPNSIPDIDVQDLLDRSKADGLAKILLVWQVVWFCLSCLNRAVQGLPLCLLEVATLAHAFCALLTYAFWWKKPKDVGQPTVLEGDEIRPLGAFMSVVSPARRFVVAGMITLTYSSEFEKGILEHLRTADPLLDPGLLSLVRGWQAALSHSLSMMLGALSLRREPPRYLGALKARCIFRGKIWPWYIQDGTSLPNAELDRCTARLQLFIGAQQCPVDPYDVGVVYVAPVASLQSFSISLDSDRFVRSFLAILVLAAAYGLPHLIGFKALFTTTTEQQMWQVATILILAAGAALSVLFVVLFVLKELLWDLSSTLDSIFGFLLSDSLLYGMFSLGLIVYFSSSAYLVAESFRQLSALPPESFILPSWGNYWPHFA